MDIRYSAPRVVAYVEEDADKHWQMPKISWMKPEMSPSFIRRSTSRASATTTTDGYADAHSSWATLCSASSRQARRSWNHPGKALILFTRSSQEGHTAYATRKRGKT
jgi:hypothetical protein